MQSYQDFTKFYQSIVSDKNNLSRRAGSQQLADSALKTGKIDLDALNYAARRRVQEMASETLKLPNIMHKYGMPGLDLPSSNAYRHLTKFDVDMQGAVHPAAAILNSMYFNLDPNANLQDSVTKGISNMMSFTELQSAMNQFSPTGGLTPYGIAPPPGGSKRILVLDTETSGVDTGARVRSYAAREASYTTDARGNSQLIMQDKSTTRNLFFRQPGMEGGLIQTPTGLKPLSVGATEIEGGLSTMIDVARDPTAARGALAAELEHMLTFDTIVAKNAKFDMKMLIKTAENMPGFADDDRLKTATEAFVARVRDDATFVSDIDVSSRAYFARKFDTYSQDYIGSALADASSEEAQQLKMMGIGSDIIDDTAGTGVRADAARMAEFEGEARNFLYSRRMAARALLEEAETLGGAFTPQAMNNLVANTNLFGLIYAEAATNGADAAAARDVMNMITKGSHIAETDVPLAHFVGKYIQNGQLDFETGKLDYLPAGVNRSKAKEFMQFGRSRVSKSSAPTMTTNIADVEHLSRKAINLLKSSEGSKLFKVDAAVSDIFSAKEITDLGLQSDMKGVVRYDRDAQAFKFFTSDERAINHAAASVGQSREFSTSFDINQSRASGYIRRTFNDALDGTTSRRVSFGISGVQSAIQNEAADKIALDLNYSQLGEIGRFDKAITRAAAAVTPDMLESTIGSMDRTALVESLTASAYIKSPDISIGESLVKKAIGGAEEADPRFGGLIRKATEERTLEAYSRAAARIGNPYADSDIATRALSTDLADVTAIQARRAYSALGDISEASTTGGRGLRFLKNADVLTEFGFQAFQGQDVTRIVDGDKLVQSKMLIGQDLFESMKVNIEGETEKVSLLKAMTDEAFAGKNILDDAGETIATGAEFNKIRVSGVAGTDSIVNAFIGGQGAYTRGQSRVLAESLYTAMQESIAAADISDEAIAGADDDITKRTLGQLRSLSSYFSGKTRDEAITELSESLHTKGAGLAALRGQVGADYISALERTGQASAEGSDVLLPRDQTARLVATSQANTGDKTGAIVISQFEDSKASALNRGLSSADEAMRGVEADTKALRTANIISDHLDDNRSIRDEILSRREGLKIGKEIGDIAGKARAAYAKAKKPASLAGLGALVAGAGYYAYKKSQENDMYDEVMDPMPTMPAMAPRQDLYREDFMSGQNFSATGDPLATAGVVGNLDRNKIGHTRMGPDKYNSLFGG